MGGLTILVGANGAGKSNFLDALAFVSDSLTDSVELAFRSRGGLSCSPAPFGRPPDPHRHFASSPILDGEYVADVLLRDRAAEKSEQFSVARERCHVEELMGASHSFEVERGRFKTPIEGIRPSVAHDRLALFAASATPEFRPVYNFLTGMRFYSIVPSELRRKLQPPDAGDVLRPDGSNASGCSKAHQGRGPDRYRRINVTSSRRYKRDRVADHKSVGQWETVEFRQDSGQKHPWTFDALQHIGRHPSTTGVARRDLYAGRATLSGSKSQRPP